MTIKLGISAPHVQPMVILLRIEFDQMVKYLSSYLALIIL